MDRRRFPLALLKTFVALAAAVEVTSGCAGLIRMPRSSPAWQKSQLAITRIEAIEADGIARTRYSVAVLNPEAYPASLFQTSSQYPSCQQGAASRLVVTIYGEYADRHSELNQFCALANSSALAQLWFDIPQGKQAPARVYAMFTDRNSLRTTLVWYSKVVPVQSR